MPMRRYSIATLQRLQLDVIFLNIRNTHYARKPISLAYLANLLSTLRYPYPPPYSDEQPNA